LGALEGDEFAGPAENLVLKRRSGGGENGASAILDNINGVRKMARDCRVVRGLRKGGGITKKSAIAFGPQKREKE